MLLPRAPGLLLRGEEGHGIAGFARGDVRGRLSRDRDGCIELGSLLQALGIGPQPNDKEF